ncbi:hypothetical protein GUJ93_ZPchr0003g18067 [Zizania palustris]|uniref:Core-2/I-branching beta-16-N-acetylglucosaminyltransferase family protein n=1 Tax=Zizania palustris TaxID=103762 RepID=A0A8J5S2A8_ZIZPA|nr:hypothetical protein GUJ93_ZPchr0003g18067 [Zizania palustris]
MQARVASMEDVKEARQPAAGAGAGAGAQGRVFPTGMLKVFLGFLLLCGALSAVGMYMARHTLAAAAPALFRPCLGAWGSTAAEEPEGLEQWTRPPDRLDHAMTDDELLWRASFAPRVRQYPFRRVPKVAFMFLTRGPLPLAPLWERFFRHNEGRYSIYVHALPSYRANFTSDSVFYRRQIPSKVAEWGEMTMCDAERRLLANALLDISNEWFVLVSETCIPIFDFNTTYQYLQNSSQSFLMAFDDPGPYGRGRYNWNMTPEVELTQWRKGSQWFEVDRELAIAIVKDTLYHPKFKEFCRPHSASTFHQSAAKHLQPLVTLAQRNSISRRGLLTLLTSTAAIPEASESRKALLQEYLNKSKENKEKNDKERLDDYYKRNYRDYFGLIEGAAREKKQDELTESEKGILEWLDKNR